MNEMFEFVESWIFVDAIITDPPYDISNSGGWMMARDNRKFIKEIDWMWMTKWFDIVSFLDMTIHLFKDTKGYCWIFFCSMKQLNNYITWAINNNYQYWVMVWHKTNPAPLCNNKYLNDIGSY